MSGLPYRKSCCSECPWRKDVDPGRFPPQAFKDLAKTSYDIARKVFACHKSEEATSVICAGFLLRGAAHNLTVRMGAIEGSIDLRLVKDEGLNLFDDFKSMAIANGVRPSDSSLVDCRSQKY
ncbi:MAG: hypothetical protein EOP06_03080 [Proteobacteria bacterium]|nr:MAG: hypothetical protein EOP06_03080 [Pseudomonadota bacterium]